MSGLTYEEIRQFYACSEQREQADKVMIQRLLIENKELRKKVEKYESSNNLATMG